MTYETFKLYNPHFEQKTGDDAFRTYCYNLYQLDWLKEHGHLLDDVFISLITETRDADEDALAEEILQEWPGPDSQIYACFWEFCENEYQDEEYMRSILNDEDYDLYIKDIQNPQSDY